MNLPKPKVVLPRDLRGQKNGELDRKLLRKVEPDFWLHHKAAAAWEILAGLAAQENIHLSHVGDYRPYSRQLSLFLDRMRDYPDAKREKQVTRKFQGKTWYLHKGAPVAVPGTSNHGLGLAADACVVVKHKGKEVKQSITTKPAKAKRSGLNFLLANAVSLGWGWELDSEPWHIRYYAGDAGTPRLNEFLG